MPGSVEDSLLLREMPRRPGTYEYCTVVPVQSVVVVMTLYVPGAGTCPGALGTGVPAGPLSAMQAWAVSASQVRDHHGLPANHAAGGP